MLKLSLVAKQGNGVRYFPHAGYLRLTPLKVEGIVRTRIDEDNKPLLCSGLYVALRCYEARLGLGLGLGLTSGSTNTPCAEHGTATGTGNPSPTSNTNVLYEIVVPLWKPERADDDYGLLGDGEWPFKIVLPPNASPVCSTVHFQEYRVFWRVEAVLTHTPITGVGMRLVKMQEVPLVRYDTRQDLPPQPPNKWRRVPLPSRPSKPLPSTLKYIINNPPFPFAPLDHVPVTLKFSLPPGINVTSVALSIERRLMLKSSHSSTPDTLHNDFTDGMESTSHLIQYPLPSSFKSATTMVITSKTIPVSSSSDQNRQTGHGACTVTMTLQIPQAKSLSHWSLGETIHTSLASVRFFLKSKITITDSTPTQDSTFRSPHPFPLSPSQPSIPSLGSNSQSSSHSYTLDLQEKELYVIATNEADRREAISKYKEAVGRGRKRRINTAGKEREKETTVPPVTELKPTSTSPTTPLTSECDSPARGRSLVPSATPSKVHLRSRKEKESSKSSQRASHQKKAKEKSREPSTPLSSLSPEIELKEVKSPAVSTSEAKTDDGKTRPHDTKYSTSSSNSQSNVRSKTKTGTANRTHRLTLGFFTPRSRRFFRQGLASDGDGNVDIDGEGDEDYVLVNNGTPLSAPVAWRSFGRRHLFPPSHYPSSPTSPCETSADESSNRVVYFLNGKGRSREDNTSTNVSTGTTATTASEGTEEIFGPPTPPDDELETPPTHVSGPSPSGSQDLTASLPPTRPRIALPPPSSFPGSLHPSIPIPTPTPTTASISFSWDDREERFETRDKEKWETELKETITAHDGIKTEAVMNGASEKLKTKAKNSSTIAGLRFRRKKSRKLNSNTAHNAAQTTGPSPVLFCESDSCPTPSHLSPPSPVYIPFSPSTPDLPVTQTPALTVPPSPASPMAESKSNSKSKGRTLGFGLNWGFGWG